MTDDLPAVYRRTLDTNLSEISEILHESKTYTPELFEQCTSLLKASMEKIVSKWESGEKYTRTKFVQEAFAALYPKELVSISIIVDAMVNILDDLLDEDLGKQEKVFYVMEYLRVFSDYCALVPNENIQKSMGSYFNKCISLAIAEQAYQKKVIEEDDLEKILSMSHDLLLLRAHDIDIFLDIALDKNNDPSYKEKVLDIGRIYRAISIFIKDIKDYDHDVKQSQVTLVTIMKKDKASLYQEYTNKILANFVNDAKKINDLSSNFNPQDRLPITNFYKMIVKEAKI